MGSGGAELHLGVGHCIFGSADGLASRVMELHRYEGKDLLLKRERLTAGETDIISDDAHGAENAAGELGRDAKSVGGDGTAASEGSSGVHAAMWLVTFRI